jgi:hypothetical protein
MPGAGDGVDLGVWPPLEHQGVGLGHVHVVRAVDDKHRRVRLLIEQRAADEQATATNSGVLPEVVGPPPCDLIKQVWFGPAMEGCCGQHCVLELCVLPAAEGALGQRTARVVPPRSELVSYFRASKSSRQACSQRRQASAQTRQCGMWACRSHSSPQLRQTATQDSSSGRIGVDVESARVGVQHLPGVAHGNLLYRRRSGRERLLDPGPQRCGRRGPDLARGHLPLAHHQERRDGLHAEALLQPG